MKKIIYIIISFICIISYSCSNKPIKEYVYVNVKDTTSKKIDSLLIINLKQELYLSKDSLYNYKDSLELLKDSFNKTNNKLREDLLVANIKLNRIKEYNRIAAKGNNIKYLRGWINRVFK